MAPVLKEGLWESPWGGLPCRFAGVLDHRVKHRGAALADEPTAHHSIRIDDHCGWQFAAVETPAHRCIRVQQDVIVDSPGFHDTSDLPGCGLPSWMANVSRPFGSFSGLVTVLIRHTIQSYPENHNPVTEPLLERDELRDLR